MSLIITASGLAYEVHAGQTYGDQPYTVHLEAAVAVLHRFGFVLSAEAEALLAAAWLHDSVEDTDLETEDIRREVSPQVAALVGAVTNEPGRNRQERNARTYPNIRATPDAVIVKLADRIANVEASWASQDARLFMYHREYRGFRQALRDTASVSDGFAERAGRMWDHLDKLLGYWER